MTDQSPPPVTLRFDQLWHAVTGGDVAVFAAPTTRFRPVDWLPRRVPRFVAGVAVGGDHGGPMLTLRRPCGRFDRARPA